jgi:dihydrolipoamide dehydrogenase
MQRIDTDVAILGAGTAGLAAYRAAKAAGKSALLIEGGPYGTTCARVGCMPSKLLIAAAEAAHAPSKWKEFGLESDSPLRVNGKAVMERVRRERDRFVGFVVTSVEGIPAADRLVGRARFTDASNLMVDGHKTVSFRSAVVATGSSPAVPPFLSALGDRLVVNDDVFEWRDLPRSVAVFGPGVIGLELGQALSRLGVKVRMFGVGGLVGPFSDPALRAYAAATLGAEFYLDADAKGVQVERIEDASGAGVKLRFRTHDGRQVEETVDYVLAATGRTPNVKGLGLEHTALELDARGVPIFDRRTLQCGTSHLFIAGDANNDLPLLHEAADEGRIAGDNAALHPAVRAGSRRVPLGVVFTEPQFAVVGRRYADLPAGRTVTGIVPFEDQGRSRVMLRNRGLAHVYAEIGTGRVLGAELIGPDVEHLAHLLAWGIQAGMTVERMLEMPFYHPVVEEGLRTALRDAARKLSTGERLAA